MGKLNTYVSNYLDEVRGEVNKLVNPDDNTKVDIPHFDLLKKSSESIEGSKIIKDKMFVIQTMLGRAGCVGMNTIDKNYKINFPFDHHLHLDMGPEWYWIGMHSDIINQKGEKGRISALIVMKRNRCVGTGIQKEAGWTNEEVNLVNNLATVTVDFGVGNKKYYRRNKNSKWLLSGEDKDDDVKFSKYGDNFLYKCGDDIFSGSENVLPLNVIVDDGDNMKINITLKHQVNFKVDDSFFLQGIPSLHIGGSGGTGLTPIPTPGIYYSWPQLLVTGEINVGGESYKIDNGLAWMDHQLMMTSLENADRKINPIPFVEDFKPYNGWTWQYFNLKNGDAFTGSSFMTGEMTDKMIFPYGYYIKNDSGKWKAHYITGSLLQMYEKEFPEFTEKPDSKKVTLPIIRSFDKLKSLFGKPLTGVGVPWNDDGTFNETNWALTAEIPADFFDLTGEFADGVGYLEYVGFQKVEDFEKICLDILNNDKLPI
ncbi:MAG TPA: hypothetical protein PLG90_05080 [Ignavibacteria bacterium]|nr:hypothetical protein [Ignavibacteria bacterium]